MKDKVAFKFKFKNANGKWCWTRAVVVDFDLVVDLMTTSLTTKIKSFKIKKVKAKK